MPKNARFFYAHFISSYLGNLWLNTNRRTLVWCPPTPCFIFPDVGDSGMACDLAKRIMTVTRLLHYGVSMLWCLTLLRILNLRYTPVKT